MPLPNHQKPMNATIEHYIPDATKMAAPDYYAVYCKRGPKDRGGFLTNVLAKGQADALREQIKRKREREKDPPAGLKIDLDFYSVRPTKIDCREAVAAGTEQEPAILRGILRMKTNE